MPSLDELLADSDRLVLAAEARSNTLTLTTVRLGIGALGGLLVLLEHIEGPTAVAMGTYVALGLVLFIVARRFPKSTELLPWALPLIDVPMVAIAQAALFDQGTSRSGLALTSACVNLGFVAVAAVSLSYRVVVATAVMGLLAFGRILWITEVSRQDADFPVLVFIVASALLAWTSARTLPLALELRRRAWAGRYKVGRRVGAGGMAEVFSATLRRDDGVERRVALKRILPALASRDDMQRLFMRELELASLMSHPNIVQVLDHGADEQGPFLVMEYVEGRPLNRVLRNAAQRKERVSAEVCMGLAEQLLSALEHIHTRRDATGAPLSLMHRDLNPPNVLITFQGEVKVSDFGIARPALSARLTQTNEMRGKLSYAAPEQLLGLELTSRLDLFALGILLAEVALGAHPFAAGETVVLERQIAGELPTLAAARPDLPPAFLKLIYSLLEPTAERRCRSAAVGLGQLRTLSWDAENVRRELARLAQDERDGTEEVTRPA